MIHLISVQIHLKEEKNAKTVAVLFTKDVIHKCRLYTEIDTMNKIRNDD